MSFAAQARCLGWRTVGRRIMRRNEGAPSCSLLGRAIWCVQGTAVGPFAGLPPRRPRIYDGSVTPTTLSVERGLAASRPDWFGPAIGPSIGELHYACRR